MDDSESESENEKEDGVVKWGIGAGVVVAVSAASWWMLLMTAAYFHTWFEKVRSMALSCLELLLYEVSAANILTCSSQA